MKKIFLGIIFCFAITPIVNGQVAIGKQTVDGSSTILDFNSTSSNTQGIILPSVNNTALALSSSPTYNNGTFVFDKSDSTIKMYENNSWKNLSDTGNAVAIAVNSSEESSALQGVVIGSDTSNAKGILVLEYQDKSMILPKIANPHTAVKSPYPGMMCYDTVGKAIALFDGNAWNYWK